MADALFRVVRAGPHVTIQDRGRPGHMRFGVPASGAMDRGAFQIANLALGNPPGQPGIEVSLGGLTLECAAGSITLAIAGGGFAVDLGERPVGSWTVLTMRAGQRLTIRPGPWGSWTYLAFAGELQAETWLGSAATHSISGFGGGKLETGQELTIRQAEVRPACEGAIPCPVWARPRATIHAVPGPQHRFFTGAALENLGSATFTLTDSYDRMGVRLKGPPLLPEAALSIPSEPILRGSVQVSGDGVATVLLADHQTTGGYPKIATILDADLDGFVQLRPRAPLRFRLIGPETAVDLARMRGRMQAAFAARLAARLKS